jgi:hypothetical protein
MGSPTEAVQGSHVIGTLRDRVGLQGRLPIVPDARSAKDHGTATAKPAQMGIACATRTVSHLMFRVGQNLDEQGLRDAL